MKRHASFNCAAVQSALKSLRDSMGKKTKRCHYQNEIGPMRHALTGYASTRYNFANPTSHLAWLTRRVVCMNSRLLAAHVPFKQRKKACRDYVIKQLPKHPPKSASEADTKH
jgi:hypothetical protein